MPCRSDYDDVADAQAEARAVREKLDKTTRLLCEVLSGKLGPKVITAGSQELCSWWIEHQALDAKRKEQERREQERQRVLDEEKAARLEDEAKKLRKKWAK